MVIFYFIILWYIEGNIEISPRDFHAQSYKYHQLAFTYTKSTMKTTEQLVKFIQSWQQKKQNDVSDVILVSLFVNFEHI